MKKQQTNEQIARVIERQQVISYKKKPTSKPYKEFKDQDDEIDSAPSLKSGVFSDDSVRFNKKNTPLPQLNRQKKRIFSKNLMAQTKQVNNYLEKQVRQHDNLVLKQKNNYLTTENMKLKTKIMNLQKDNSRLVKIIEEDQGKVKTKPGIILKDSRAKGSQSISLKMTIKNLRKQLDDQKKQNQKIKWSIKFTTIKELQCERQAIMEETNRLRRMLEQQQMRRAHLKMKQQGVSYMQQKVNNLNDKVLNLMRQNSELNNKIKKSDDVSKKSKQLSQNEKNLSKMLYNARRVIKEKQKQIQEFKIHSNTQKNIDKQQVVQMQIKSSKDLQKHQIFNNKRKIKDTQKRVMSKSAQKYRKTAQQNPSQVQKLRDQNDLLVKKVQQLNLLLKEQREKGGIKKLGEFSRDQIDVPSEDQVNKINRFLTFRFKAHHLNLQEAQKYLINSQIVDQALNQTITLAQMAQYLVAQPFSIISGRYLQIFLIKLFYPQLKPGQKITLDDGKKIKKQQILKNFKLIISQFKIMQQVKQQQMFIQVAQLITNYHQHILTALNRKKNGEGTIQQADIIAFFNQIQLQKQFIDFIITQIILQSLDLQHLNYYSMFQIFYMPPQQIPQDHGQVPSKKKFQVDHNQVVKQQDQEYQQSRSYVDAKQKTQSQKDQQEISQENYSPNDNKKYMMKQKQENRKNKQNPNQEIDEYQQLFEEEKMDRVPEQENNNEQIVQDQIKPYKMEQLDQEYQEDFQSPA